MSLQKGGLILTQTELLRYGIFAPVLQMLHSGSARVRLLTARSLKGFMFVLDVDPLHSVYKTFRHIGQGSITSFIIKIVIITQQPNTTLSYYGRHEKKSESKETFLSEARMQQNVWLESVTGGRPEFTPSVANLALFDDNTASYICISQIYSIVDTRDSNTLYCLEYLKSMFGNRDNSLGILLMPNIESSTTLGDYLDNPPATISPQSDKITVLGNTISNILRLFIMHKVIHLDLHAENSLVVPSTKKSFIIDFGTATNLSEPGDIYLSANDKEQLLMPMANAYKDTFLDLATNKGTRISAKIAFIEMICREISNIGRSVNQPMFNFYRGDPEAYQMDWIEDDVYNSVDKDFILIHAFDKLAADCILIHSATTKKTITSYTRKNQLFDLSKDVSHYSFNFDVKRPPVTMIIDDDDDEDEDDEGKGKTKKKRNKKSKKSKKIKKIKKIKKTRKSYKSKY
jgi:serine/threonine protein kinase